MSLWSSLMTDYCGYISASLQTADACMLIINIVARYPGSTNDSFVWTNSAIRQKMEDLYRDGEQCWLIGMCQ